MSSAPAEPSGLERPFRAHRRRRAGSSGHFERPSGAERARAAISSAAAAPSGLERPFRAPQRSRAGSMSQTSAGAEFSRPGRAELSRLERPFRAPQRSRAGSSGHFERPSGVERARAAVSSAPTEPSGPRSSKRRQVRCFRGQAEPAERVKLEPWSLQGPLRKFRIRHSLH